MLKAHFPKDSKNKKEHSHYWQAQGYYVFEMLSVVLRLYLNIIIIVEMYGAVICLVCIDEHILWNSPFWCQDHPLIYQ